MRRQVPLALCFVFGVVMVLIEFSPHPYSKSLYNEVINWSLIIGPFALVLGVATLVQTHWIRIRRRAEYWQYSFVVFIGMIVMVAIGIPFGPSHKAFKWLFKYIQVPMDATMFSLLAFFIASASYRAFRARTLEATLLLVAALIVMIGNAPIGDFIWNKIMPFGDNLPSTVRQWILENPNLSSRRGVILGVSLGVISQSIRIILGIERSYLGGGD
ncbi:hypothetical protein CMK17_00920 [Candidatus Poribacteria bacterium]|nr:hypothetical protein [Candidatus Poribacteria bacterium]MEE3193893.1 hypothetical protein [Candidatus Poribacteria bacterium]